MVTALPFTKMNDCVDKTVTADVTSTSRVVTISENDKIVFCQITKNVDQLKWGSEIWTFFLCGPTVVGSLFFDHHV